MPILTLRGEVTSPELKLKLLKSVALGLLGNMPSAVYVSRHGLPLLLVNSCLSLVWVGVRLPKLSLLEAIIK